MLVLTRKAGEEIVIDGGRENGGVTIRVTRIKSNRVSIAIDAAEESQILRREVLDRDE